MGQPFANNAPKTKFGKYSGYLLRISFERGRTAKNLFFNALRKNPALGFATIVGTNVAAKYGGDLIYDKINDMTRIIMQLPDPEAAYKNNEQIRNLMDAREELLWSGGAMGLQHIFPLVKRLIGKSIGVNKNMTLQVGEVMDEAGNMVPINANMLEIAKRYDIPMNVFSTSSSGFVKGAGSVIGLFPFVATKARQAQNAQQVALSKQINNVLNDLSPIGLFKDSNVVASKSFKTMINKYDRTGVLSNVQKGKAMYGDFTKVNEYQDAIDLVTNSKNMFNELPSDIREKFSNNPGEFFEWITNPANNKEAIELGLVKAPIIHDEPKRTTAKAVAEPSNPPAPKDASE